MKKLTTCLIFIMLFGALAGLIYHHADSIHIPLFKPLSKKNASPKNTVVCAVVANINPRLILKMNIAVPCEDERQKKDLAGKMPRIKSVFITTMDPKQMKAWVVDRDYASIKSAFLTVVNRFASRPVKDVYFESFNYF